MKNIPASTAPNAIPLLHAGSEEAETAIWTLATNEETWVRNVSRPSLTPFLPKPGTGNGAAVLVVPGGGFQFVSLSNEGWPVAQWLAELGYAAFVLTYRTETTPKDADAFDAALKARFDSLMGDPVTQAAHQKAMAQQRTIASQDADAALRLIRARSEDWGVRQDQVGILGFSAGAMIGLATLLGVSVDAKPDFMGYIYGPMEAVAVPQDAPPLFAAIAANDPLFAGHGFGLVEAWQSGGGGVEFHYYDGGGHGFGSHKKGTTSDLWFEQFTAWMERRVLVR
jgi:acetyl esterase/lipase